MFTIWMRAINPGLTPDKAMATYTALLQAEPNPALGKSLLWMIISGVLAAVIDGLAGLALGAPLAEVLGAALGSLVATPITTVVSFMVSAVALFVAARVLGGQGALNEQAYLQAAIQAPLMIIGTVFQLGLLTLTQVWPGFGLVGFLAFPLVIYFGWLGLVALRVPHGYSGGKAFLTALLAGMVVLPLGACVSTMLARAG